MEVDRIVAIDGETEQNVIRVFNGEDKVWQRAGGFFFLDFTGDEE